MNSLSQFFVNIKNSILGVFPNIWLKIKTKFNQLRQKIKASKYKNWILATISIFSVVVIVGGGYLLTKTPLFQRLFNKEPKGNQWTSYKPKPAPLAHGKQTYKISGSTPGAPKITEASVDPIDPGKNSSEVWTLKVIEPNDKNITEVSVTVFTDDNKKQQVTLKRIDGNDQDGTWQGSLSLDNSYDYEYVAILTAKNTDNKVQTVTLTFR